MGPGTEEIFLSYVSYCQNWVSANLLKHNCWKIFVYQADKIVGRQVRFGHRTGNFKFLMASLDEFTSWVRLLLNLVGKYCGMFRKNFLLYLIAVSFRHLQVAPLPRIPTSDRHAPDSRLLHQHNHLFRINKSWVLARTIRIRILGRNWVPVHYFLP
jgi:hypothetical protein